MKGYIKTILLLLVVLFPWSISINEGHAKDNLDEEKQIEVKVTNNYYKEDTIEFLNLEIGSQYFIYSDVEKQKLIDTFTAESSTKIIIIAQLGNNAGELYITVKKADDEESEPFKVTYSAEPITKPIVASYVTITNNYGKADVISFKNIEKNATYTIYKDAQKTKKIDQFKATSTAATRTIQQLGATKGSIYITVTTLESAESNVTKVDYKAEKLPALSVKNITVTNYFGANDVITLKGLTKGYNYVIYRDAKLKSKLTSFTATATTKTISVKQLGINAGTLYVIVSKSGYESSTYTKVNYTKERHVPINTKYVSVINNSLKDKISFKGLKKGYVYTIYKDSQLKKKLTSFKATGTTKTITIKQIGPKAGVLYIVVTKSPQISSPATKVSFLGEITPALASKNVIVSNTIKQDTIKMTGLKKGTTYTIYKDNKKKNKITSFTATGSTKTITIKQLGVAAGKVYITAQASGYRVSALTTVSYGKEVDGRKIAYLTFDDGPSANTAKILDILKKYNIKATFFVNGRTDSQSVKLYKRIVAEGHSIGSHIYSHDYSVIYRNKTAFMNSFDKLQNYIKSLTGVKMEILRFPGGSNNTVSYRYGGKGLMKQLTSEMKRKGYVYFDWNVDSTDASAAKQSKSKIVSSVLINSKGKSKAVILMHDASGKTTTVDALPEIIAGLKKQGFQFDKITKTSYAPQFLK